MHISSATNTLACPSPHKASLTFGSHWYKRSKEQALTRGEAENKYVTKFSLKTTLIAISTLLLTLALPMFFINSEREEQNKIQDKQIKALQKQVDQLFKKDGQTRSITGSISSKLDDQDFEIRQNRNDISDLKYEINALNIDNRRLLAKILLNRTRSNDNFKYFSDNNLKLSTNIIYLKGDMELNNFLDSLATIERQQIQQDLKEQRKETDSLRTVIKELQNAPKDTVFLIHDGEKYITVPIDSILKFQVNSSNKN